MSDDDEVLRVITRVGSGHPELREDLLALPPQARAERLRSLASAMLMLRGMGSIDPGTVQAHEGQAGGSEDEERRKRFQRLRGRLGDAE